MPRQEIAESDYFDRPDAKRHLKVLEVLRKWDPIGVIDDTNQDEYDSYAPDLIRMLDAQWTCRDIEKWMHWLATKHMGLCFCNRKHTTACIEELIKFWSIE